MQLCQSRKNIQRNGICPVFIGRISPPVDMQPFRNVCLCPIFIFPQTANPLFHGTHLAPIITWHKFCRLLLAGFMAFLDMRGDLMPDYQEMYLTMFRASEKARKLMEEAENEIIRAQQQCEEPTVLAFTKKD